MLRRFYARKRMAPQVGFEPTTLRLTAECSAIELLRSVLRHLESRDRVEDSESGRRCRASVIIIALRHAR